MRMPGRPVGRPGSHNQTELRLKGETTMTVENLRNALNDHFTERGREVLTEEILKLVGDWYDVLDAEPENETANERIAVLSGLLLALQ